MSLCIIPISCSAFFEIDPVLIDDIFIDENRKVIIGRENHLCLPQKYFDKLCKHEEVKVRLNLNQGFENFKNKPMSHGIDHILDYIIKKSDELKEKDLRKVNCILINPTHYFLNYR